MWDWAIWAALVVSALAGLAAFALLVVRVLRAWRDLQGTGREVLRRLDDFSRAAEAVSGKLAAAGEATAELQRSRERLRVSLAKLAVLRAALDEVDGAVARAAANLPQK
jgi:hypothetical protein